MNKKIVGASLIALIIIISVIGYAVINQPQQGLDAVPEPPDTTQPSEPSPTEPTQENTSSPELPVPEFTLAVAHSTDYNEAINSGLGARVNVTIKNQVPSNAKYYTVELKLHRVDPSVVGWVQLMEKPDVPMDITVISNLDYTSVLSEPLPYDVWDFRVNSRTDAYPRGNVSDWSSVQTLTVDDDSLLDTSIPVPSFNVTYETSYFDETANQTVYKQISRIIIEPKGYEAFSTPDFLYNEKGYYQIQVRGKGYTESHYFENIFLGITLKKISDGVYIDSPNALFVGNEHDYKIRLILNDSTHGNWSDIKTAKP